jgi:hypothetical protein
MWAVFGLASKATHKYHFLVPGVIGFGWMVPCEIGCEIHVAQLLQTLSSITAEHTNSSVEV